MTGRQAQKGRHPTRTRRTEKHALGPCAPRPMRLHFVDRLLTFSCCQFASEIITAAADAGHRLK